MISTDELRQLVRPDDVHKRVYTDPEILSLEMQRAYGQARVHVGRESQVPKAGDYHATQLGDHKVIMVRVNDQKISGLYYRCPHRGANLVAEGDGWEARRVRSSPFATVRLFTPGVVPNV
ncbi:hypothetical protein CER19_27645 [Pseudomonas sp. GL93]|uniref:Rieske 2Fe-2S domain-containing protein n=1 Tax=Pseudomonas sp. GL93 TaxID=2014741 RepID=UPI000E30FFD3|nr:Rieske 2Fe-2S domain-containing protein [Pseudomonas sp. GL93]RFD24003.1 hypothetical protein CER19_27645 [Pseudomonas sp. GL93]